MFRMSREELIARLQSVMKSDYSNLHPSEPISLKLTLYTAGGILVCDSAALPTREDVISEGTNAMQFSPLNLALSLDLPGEIPPEIQEESFVYCKEARFIPYGGKEIDVGSLVVPLSAVIGFSLASVN